MRIQGLESAAARFRERVSGRLRPGRRFGEESGESSEAGTAKHRVRDAWQRAVDATTGLAAFFPQINIDDAYRERLEQAHAMAFGSYDGSLAKHWIAVRLRGVSAETGFISSLKGKVAEIDAAELLTENGFKNVQIAADPTQAIWDISGVAGDGQPILWQVKTGTAEYAAGVKEAMSQSPNVDFLVSSEVYDQLTETSADFADRLTELKSNAELTRNTREGLDALCGNLGIDIPDRLSKALPDAAVLMLGIQIVIEIVRNERELTDADRTEKNKLAVVRALMLMSRFGIHRVMTIAGAAVGAAAGGVVPIGGNVVGSTLGTVSGLAGAIVLNRKLEPQMLKIALDITDIGQDEFNRIRQARSATAGNIAKEG